MVTNIKSFSLTNKFIFILGLFDQEFRHRSLFCRKLTQVHPPLDLRPQFTHKIGITFKDAWRP